MISATALDLITQAMAEVGALRADGTMSAADANLGLIRLNGLLGKIGANPLMVRATIDVNFPLTAGTLAYTIGLTGVWVNAKPIRIDNAYIHDANGLDTPLSIISGSEYAGFANKTITTGRPTDMSYDPGATQQAAQLGTVSLYPNPDASIAYRIYMSVYQSLTQIPTLATTLTFEDIYYEYLGYNLAFRLWRAFHDDNTPVPKDIRNFASVSRLALENLNSVTPVAELDLPGCSGTHYNVYTDMMV